MPTTSLLPPPPPALELHRRGLSLRVKLLGLALTGLLASALIAFVALRQMNRTAEAAALTLSARMAESLALQVRHAREHEAHQIDAHDHLGAQEVLDYMHRADQRDIELVDLQLNIVADTDHEDIGKPLTGVAAITARRAIETRQPQTFIEAAHGDEPERHQTVVVELDADGRTPSGALIFEHTTLLADLQATAARARWVVLSLSLVLGFGLVTLALWGSRRLTGPLQALRRAAEQLANGAAVQRIDARGQDEISDLARAFDHMAACLTHTEQALRREVADRRAAQEQVQAINDVLEQRVLDRTALLQQSHARLDAELQERRRMETQLEQLARFDPLTGLPNRSQFLHRLGLAIERAQRNDTRVALMFVDLDRFKSINDSLGHEVGDKVLQEVAQRARSLLRQNDIVSRIGGDEFTVIVEDIAPDDEASVAAIAQKLVDGFASPLLIDGRELYLTLSLGIAIAPTDSRDLTELMKQADFAMYHAKSAGRNGFQFHSQEMTDSARQRLAIEHAMRHALTHDEFSLAYQPRISASSGLQVGMEALLRWTSAELGRVTPDAFIPIAEDTGMILPLGDWVMETAFRQHTAWRLDGLQPGVMAINVSARQFRQPDFAAHVLRIAMACDIAPQAVEIEVTESMLMRDPEHAAAAMAELRALGFGIAIDDFGTGYSSLSHLKLFPATKIKIDRAFVQTIDSRSEDAAIAAAIVAMASTLRMQVTAEGVETAAQLAHLGQLDCSEYQGYLFSQPLPETGMRALLQSGRGAHPGAVRRPAPAPVLPLTGTPPPAP